jgi:hypothetical protein
MINALDGDAFGVDFRKFLRAIDVLVQGAVKSKTLSSPPGSPVNGDRYIVAGSPTGAWSGQAKSIAVWTTDNPASPSGVWEFYAPKAGWLVYNVADATVYVYDGSTWGALSGGGGGGGSLATLSDVALSSPTTGQVLTYNGTDWINAAAGGGGGANVNGDSHPLSPSAFDDEFESGSLGGIWTARNSPTLTFKNGSVIFDQTGSGSSNWGLITQSAPSAPFTIACKIKINLKPQNFFNAAIVLYETSSGKLIMFGPSFNTNALVAIQRFTNVTTYGSTPLTDSLTNYPSQKYPDYYAIEDDGTNLNYKVSDDGCVWRTIFSEAHHAFITADAVGVGLDIETSSARGFAAFDWFRSI